MSSKCGRMSSSVLLLLASAEAAVLSAMVVLSGFSKARIAVPHARQGRRVRAEMVADQGRWSEIAVWARLRSLAEIGLQLADDLVPELLGQVVAHAVEQHQACAADRLCNSPAARRAHQLVLFTVDDHRRRLDLPVVAEQAATAQDRGEVPGDAGRVVGPLVTFDGVRAQPLLGLRVAGAADDLGHPDRVLDDALPR